MNPSNGDGIKNVALYTRVSTEDQAREGFSLDSQLERLRAFCLAREWDIAGEYVDAGYSGRNTRRPQYQQMFEDSSKWDGILVIKMDRIHRNRGNFIDMMDDLKKKDKQFISMQDSLDTSTAMGRFVMGIIQDIAQLESEQIGERVAIALIQKAKKEDSGFMGHRVPFGYRWDADHKKFIEISKKLDLIKKIFDLYIYGDFNPILETEKGWINKVSGKLISKQRDVDQWTTYYKNHGHNFRSVGKELNISETNIRYYLNNIFYVGYERWCHYFWRINNDGFKPIISPDLWNKTQIKMRTNCRSHSYDPILIPEDIPDTFTFDKTERKLIPLIQRAKHNLNY